MRKFQVPLSVLIDLEGMTIVELRELNEGLKGITNVDVTYFRAKYPTFAKNYSSFDKESVATLAECVSAKLAAVAARDVAIGKASEAGNSSRIASQKADEAKASETAAKSSSASSLASRNAAGVSKDRAYLSEKRADADRIVATAQATKAEAAAASAAEKRDSASWNYNATRALKDDVESIKSTVSSYKNSANESKVSAAASASSASTSSTKSANSALASQNSNVESKRQADLSAGSATRSQGYNVQSSNARRDSAAAKDESVAAKNESVAAKNESVAAKNESVAASVSAKASEIAASNYKNEALSSKSASIAARNSARSYKDNAYAWAEGNTDRSSKHWAKVAEQYAVSSTEALRWKGQWDASKGAPPVPTPETPDYYKITVAGTIAGVSYLHGDTIIWDTISDAWFKIDNTNRPVTDSLASSDRTIALSARAGKTLEDKKFNKTGGVVQNGSSDTTLTIKASDTKIAKIEAIGTSQGTGMVYVGQSPFHGGGIVYNGDDNPDLPFAADTITYFRETSGVQYPVFHNSHDNSKVYFNDFIYSKGKQVYTNSYRPYCDKLTTARTISLSGDASGSIAFDGSKNVSIPVVVKDDSHKHVIANVDGLQAALNSKQSAHSHPYRADTWKPSWNDVTSKPSTFPASAHSHSIATVSGLQTALNTKASNHSHPYRADTWKPSWNDVTSKPSTFPASAHNHSSLTGVTSIGFNAERSDAVTITTTVEGTQTFLDFNLRDDSSDQYRWRYNNYTTPAGLATVMSLIPKASGGDKADLTVVGNVVAESIIENGTALSSKYLGKTAKAADADKLDGISSGGFLRSDSPDNINCDLEFQDNRKLKFGNDSDFQIWNSGSNQYFRNCKHGAITYFQGENAAGSNKTMIAADPDNTVSLYYAGSEKIRTESSGIKVTGALVATGDITAYSDRRLKTNIQPINNALKKIACISGNTYHRTDLNQVQVGVIAQEIQMQLPEAVTELDDGTLTVSHAGVIALLVESVKELKAELNELKRAGVA